MLTARPGIGPGVPGNRSLDEFADGEAEGTDADADGDPSVEPKAETYAWSASGGPCGRCGETVESRWRDGGALVCGDCKAW